MPVGITRNKSNHARARQPQTSIYLNARSPWSIRASGKKRETKYKPNDAKKLITRAHSFFASQNFQHGGKPSGESGIVDQVSAPLLLGVARFPGVDA